MADSWWTAALPFLTGILLLLVPGLVVRLAGWNVRSLTPYFFLPALSIGILAVAGAIAPLFGLRWGLIPVVALTVVAAVVAFFLRRWVGREDVPRPSFRQFAASASVVLAAAIIALQLAIAFIGPENISQTFDNIVHLNAVRLALDTGNVSPSLIGSTSDIGFYPNGWHSVVTLVSILSGADIPVAINVSNIAICALAWPMSAMALAAVFFRERAAALVITAALSTGFGAFPLLLMGFGVLYPNTAGYALIPAGLAAALLVLQATSLADRVRQGALLLVAVGAVTLCHPNALLALTAFVAVIVVTLIVRRMLRGPRLSPWLYVAGIAAAIVPWALMWRYARTPFEMSRWPPWQSTAQALGEALFLTPRGLEMTIPIAIMIGFGLVIVIRRPKDWLIAFVPFAVAGFLFVLVSGTPSNVLREVATNPWYNDSYRLAALLPVAGIPIATLGALTIIDGLGRTRLAAKMGHAGRLTLAVVAAIALFAVGIGPNITSTLPNTRATYELTDDSALLSADERALLERLDDEVPDDALIVANPWTGGALAYAIADRTVHERHIFGTPGEDEVYLDEHLRDIDTDPLVCDAVNAIGADYVLDFGSANVFRSDASGLDRVGLNDLTESDHLVLVDSEGDSARLFRIEGC